MSTQYVDENIKQRSIGNVSDCENVSKGRSYEDDSDAVISSEDGICYKFPSPPPKPMVQLDSPVNLAVPKSKITSRRPTFATQYVPVSEMNERGDNKAGASGKLVAVVPKKRRYVDTVAESNFEAIEVSRETVESPIDAPTSKKQRQHVKKRQRKSNCIDETPREKRHKDGKKQSKKVTWLPTTEESSTPFASTMKVERVKVLSLTDGPPSTKVPSNKTMKENRFWKDTMASDFDSPVYDVLLKQFGFTEDQAYVMKQSLNLICRKLYIATTFTDRFMITHICEDCSFTISHQCVAAHSTNFVRSNANVMCTTSISAESMNICSCGFGFLHSHVKKSRIQLSDNLGSINISSLYEHGRSLEMSCRSCHMRIVMRNQHHDLCSNFTNWIDLHGDYNRQFYDFIEDRLAHSSMHKLNITDLYTCKRRCCQIFHRCPEKAAPHGDNVTPLCPVTTHTRAIVTRSNA